MQFGRSPLPSLALVWGCLCRVWSPGAAVSAIAGAGTTWQATPAAAVPNAEPLANLYSDDMRQHPRIRRVAKWSGLGRQRADRGRVGAQHDLVRHVHQV